MGFPGNSRPRASSRFFVPNQRRGPNSRFANPVFGSQGGRFRNGQFNGSFIGGRRTAQYGRCLNGECAFSKPLQPLPTFTARPPYSYRKP